MSGTSERIIVVDGFRCIAVLAVLSYHYLYRFSPPATIINYYPYEYGPSILQYGFFGVQLFFVISGFVIAQTLEKTKGFGEFIIKRLIRLWPTLLLSSLITFLVVKILNQEQQFPFLYSNALDFLPSWTFIPPEFWDMVLNQEGIAYIDGVYWSLFVEMIFYISGGIIFFIKPKSFLSNWLSITLLINIIRIVTSPKNQFLFPESLNSGFDIIYNVYLKLHFSYFVYFALGIFFYSLYCKNRPSRLTLAMISTLTLLEFYFLGNNTLRVLFLCIIVLFLILAYKENWLNFLKLKVIAWIGLVSYPLYLLHENVGLILIDRMAYVTGHSSAKFLPLIVAFALIITSALIYKYYEKPVIEILKRRFNKLIKTRDLAR